MKNAIRYFTKSKKGNTEKLANQISQATGEKALTLRLILRKTLTACSLLTLCMLQISTARSKASSPAIKTKSARSSTSAPLAPVNPLGVW